MAIAIHLLLRNSSPLKRPVPNLAIEREVIRSLSKGYRIFSDCFGSFLVQAHGGLQLSHGHCANRCCYFDEAIYALSLWKMGPDRGHSSWTHAANGRAPSPGLGKTASP
jgi:hypothetical protein